MEREEKRALYPQREVSGGGTHTLAGDSGWNLGGRQVERTRGAGSAEEQAMCTHRHTRAHTHQSQLSQTRCPQEPRCGVSQLHGVHFCGGEGWCLPVGDVLIS